MLTIIGYFFSISYMPMHDLLKRKLCKENKKQKDQNALNIIASVYSRRCGSYRMYLDVREAHFQGEAYGGDKEVQEMVD